MQWNLVADSSCDLLSCKLSDEISRTVIPMKLLLEGAEWVDDDKLEQRKFMEAMQNCKGAVRSACPSPGEFLDAFRMGENIICICITSRLSGAYNSAVQAKRLAQEEMPGKNIFVLDSKATSGKMQLILQKAQALIEAGLPFDEVCAQLEVYCESTELLFSLSSFGNLIKNGRMPRIKGVLATVLGIRPVALAKDGVIEILEKPRGNRTALLRLFERIKERKPQGAKAVVITHCNNQESANALKELICTVWENCRVEILPTRGLCSLYADEKGLLVGF